MEFLQWLFIASIVIFTLTAAIFDLRTRRLPNWLNVTAFIVGVAYHVSVGGLAGLGHSMGGFVTGFGILLVLWLIGGGGGGDVKLMGALGAWLGCKYTLIVFLLSTVFAVLGSLLMLAVHAMSHGISKTRYRHWSNDGANKGKGAKGRGPVTEEMRQEHRMKRRLLPYALPVALGTWLVLAWQVFSSSNEIIKQPEQTSHNIQIHQEQ